LIDHFLTAKFQSLKEGVFLSLWNRKIGQTIDKNRPKTIVWHTTRARVIYCNINTIIGVGGRGPLLGIKLRIENKICARFNSILTIYDSIAGSIRMNQTIQSERGARAEGRGGSRAGAPGMK
jgi:hypothetical protein